MMPARFRILMAGILALVVGTVPSIASSSGEGTVPCSSRAGMRDGLRPVRRAERASSWTKADQARLLSLLRSNKANQIVREFGPRAFKPLIKRLSPKEYESAVRYASAEALGRLGDPRAVRPLIVRLQRGDWDGEMDRKYAEALGRLGDPQAVSPLLKRLRVLLSRREDEDRDGMRKTIAEALGRLNDRRAVDALIDMWLYDHDENVEQASVKALVAIGLPAVEPLITLGVGHPDPLLLSQEKNLGVLVAIGSPAVEPLLTVGLRHENVRVRKVAADALGEIGDARAVAGLVEALEDGEWSVRKMAAWALGKIGDARAVEGLLGLLGESAAVRGASVDALAQIASNMLEQPPATRATGETILRIFEALGEESDRVYHLLIQLRASGAITDQELNTATTRLQERLAAEGDWTIAPVGRIQVNLLGFRDQLGLHILSEEATLVPGYVAARLDDVKGQSFGQIWLYQGTLARPQAIFSINGEQFALFGVARDGARVFYEHLRTRLILTCCVNFQQVVRDQQEYLVGIAQGYLGAGQFKPLDELRAGLPVAEWRETLDQRLQDDYRQHDYTPSVLTSEETRLAHLVQEHRDEAVLLEEVQGALRGFETRTPDLAREYFRQGRVTDWRYWPAVKRSFSADGIAWLRGQLGLGPEEDPIGYVNTIRWLRQIGGFVSLPTLELLMQAVADHPPAHYLTASHELTLSHHEALKVVERNILQRFPVPQAPELGAAIPLEALEAAL